MVVEVKSENTVKKLEKEGYEVKFGMYSHWQYIPYVEFENCKLYIAKSNLTNYKQNIVLNFKFDDVVDMIEKFKSYVKLLLENEKEEIEYVKNCDMELFGEDAFVDHDQLYYDLLIKK